MTNQRGQLPLELAILNGAEECTLIIVIYKIIVIIITRAMFNIQLTASEQVSILQRFSFAVEYL